MKRARMWTAVAVVCACGLELATLGFGCRQAAGIEVLQSSAPCDECTATFCADVQADCDAEPACPPLLACYAGCSPDDVSCHSACNDDAFMHDPERRGLHRLIRLLSCREQNCAGKCLLPKEPICGIVAFSCPPLGTPAQCSCLRRECCHEGTTCADNAECYEAFVCPFACFTGSAGCPDGGVDACPTSSLLSDYLSCGQTKCSGQ